MYHNCQINLKRSESLKFFNLIKQKSASQLLSLFDDNSYIKRIYKNLNIESTTILVGENKINQQLLASLISQYYLPTISSFDDLIRYHYDIFAILQDRYLQLDQILLRNKNVVTYSFDQDSFEEYKYKINNVEQFIKDHFQFQNRQYAIKMFDYWLMSIYWFDHQSFQLILPSFAIVCQHFFRHFQNSIIAKQVYVQFFRCLVYICNAARIYPSIANILNKSEYLQSQQFILIYKNAWLNLYQDLETQQNLPLVCFTNTCIEIMPEFVKTVGEILMNEDTSKRILQNTLKIISNHAFMQQLLQIYISILNKSLGKQNYLQGKHIGQIQSFGIKLLKQKEQFLYQSSIRLINEAVKYNIGNYYEEQDVRIVFNALSSNKMSWVRSALLVWQTALKVDNKILIQTFLIRRDQFFQYLLNLLAYPFKQQAQSHHCLCLQIIHLMIKPQFTICLPHILKCIEVAVQNNQILYTFVSQILKKISIVFINNDQATYFIKNGSIVNISLALLRCLYGKDYCMSIFNTQFKYLNKQILFNVTESLYLFYKNKELVNNLNAGILEDIYDMFGNLLFTSATQALVKDILREDIWIGDKKVKICALIFGLCQNIVFCLKGGESSFNKKMLQKRKIVLAMFYGLLTFKQLQEFKIPVMIQYHVAFQLFRPHQIQRLLPINLSFIAIKTYFYEVLQHYIQKQRFLQQIPAIKFRDVVHGNAEIKSEMDYKKMIDRLKSSKTEYVVSLKIQKDNFPINLNNPLLIQAVNPFNSLSTYSSSLRNSPNSSRHNVSEVLSNRGRSPSPYRNANSRVIRNQNICQICSNPSPFSRLCQECNRI